MSLLQHWLQASQTAVVLPSPTGAKASAFSVGLLVPSNDQGRGGQAKKALDAAISESYHLYPDAYRKDNDTLVNYFRSKSDSGERSIDLMVRTFPALCDLADSDGDSRAMFFV